MSGFRVCFGFSPLLGLFEMAHLYNTEVKLKYRDKKFPGSAAEYDEALRTSTTLYVGNLSFFTTEEQIHALFSMCGGVKRIIMGLDRNAKTPCGFCFVEYYERADAEACVTVLNGTKLDDRKIRTDFDWGFEEGRQFGRGKSGGQVRDDYRVDFDEGRGGWGNAIKLRVKQPVVPRPANFNRAAAMQYQPPPNQETADTGAARGEKRKRDEEEGEKGDNDDDAVMGTGEEEGEVPAKRVRLQDDDDVAKSKDALSSNAADEGAAGSVEAMDES